jgi:hypothetical protein
MLVRMTETGDMVGVSAGETRVRSLWRLVWEVARPRREEEDGLVWMRSRGWEGSWLVGGVEAAVREGLRWFERLDAER